MTSDQWMDALTKANHVRLYRANVKREILAGTLSVRDVLRERSWETDTMRLSALLMAQHRWGRAKTLKVLYACGISESLPLGKLSERKQTLLEDHLSGRRRLPNARDIERQVARWQRPRAMT